MKKIPYESFLKWEDKLNKKDRLLDVGCWDGNITMHFNRNCDAYGMDIDRNKLASAKPSIKNKLRFGDVTKKIPFRQKFDYCILFEVLEHLDLEESSLTNVNKCLKHGGRLILTTPRKINYLDFWDPAWVRWKLGFGEVHHHYSIDDLDSLLSKAGFKIDAYAIGCGLNFLWIRWANVFLRYVLRSKKFLSGPVKDGYFDLCVIARKIK